MAEHSIYKDIAERTGGDIYIGVVGPVRTGKSTFIKRFMEALVLPNIAEGYSRERARDEMPQSAAGKTVMTTEPKFVPDEAVTVKLDDNAKILPIEKSLKMIMFGDSITQGYDASSPEKSYASTLSAALGAEAINKGIAGEQFFAGFGKTKDDFAPDLITVAYGTNDWRHAKKEKFLASCKGFFENVRNNYPTVKIVAITPLWRVDINNEQEFGEPLSFVGNYIKEIAKSVPNMVVIDGTNLIDHAPEYFQTDGVHPIDAGFEQYSKNLKACEVFKKYLG